MHSVWQYYTGLDRFLYFTIYFEINFQLSQFAKVVLRTIQLIMERDFPDSYRRDDFKLAKNEIFSSLEKKLKIVLQAYEYCK